MTSPLKSRQERATEARALRAVAEYRLITSSAVSYPALGYVDDRGRVPLFKLLEFLCIHEDYSKAEAEKIANDNHQ